MSEESQSTALAGTWDAALLAPVAEINEQMLESLRRLAARPVVDAATAGERMPRRRPGLLDALRAEWCGLDSAALRRLAACPYLLLDAGFAQPQRWERSATPYVMDTPASGGYFCDDSGVALVRRTLVLAWHLARSNRLCARIVLGMHALSADRIAASRLRDLETLAALAPGWIAPRWEQQPHIWRQLIGAACQHDPSKLRQAQLRGVQLLARA
jgi:hypothetical protein